MRELFYFILGILASIGLIFLGLIITKIGGHINYLLASALLVPISGLIMLRFQKQVGIAMLLMTIPISGLGYFLFMVSKLH